MLTKIANVHQTQGSYDQARALHQKGLVLAEAIGLQTLVAEIVNRMGVGNVIQGNHVQAIEEFQQSLTLAESLGDKASMAVALTNIGLVKASQGDYADALELAERATALGRQIGSPETLHRSLYLKGKAYHALDQPPKSREAFAEAITTIEQLRGHVTGGEEEQQLFFEDRVDPYHGMIELLIAQRNSIEALSYAECAKARVLLDVLQSGRVNITKAMSRREQQQERALNSQLISLNTQLHHEKLRPQPDPSRLSELTTHLERARLEYQAFQRRLYSAHPELKIQRGEVPPFTLERARQLLPDAKTALLEFVVTETTTYLFVLTLSRDLRRETRGETRWARFGKLVFRPQPRVPTLQVYTIDVSLNDLKSRIKNFRGQLAERDQGFAESARSLYDLLLQPAHSELQGKTTLCVVPDGPLWELPFQSLQPRPSRFLLDEAALFYAPSLSVLGEMRKLGRNKAPPSRTTLPTLSVVDV